MHNNADLGVEEHRAPILPAMFVCVGQSSENVSKLHLNKINKY